MSMRVGDILEWLKTLDPEDNVGVDEGGLAIALESDPENYCEIGGLPEEE